VSQNKVLDYIKRPSILTENAPLLIMLHGYGSDENDLFSFASELPEQLFIISVRAPYPIQPYGNAWYAIHFDAPQGKWSDDEQAKTSRDRIAEFINYACEQYPVDKKKVTLLGFSQGTILSLATALTYPDRIKNVIGLSGYINEHIIDLQTSASYKHLNIYTSHGNVDMVIPIQWARQSKPFLNSLGIMNVYEEYAVGHGVAPQNFYSFRDWLSKLINH